MIVLKLVFRKNNILLFMVITAALVVFVCFLCVLDFYCGYKIKLFLCLENMNTYSSIMTNLWWFPIR